MKRVRVTLDEHVLEEAIRLSGDKTYSATVQRALIEFVRHGRARRLLELRGSGLWDGELATMRGDAAHRVHRMKRG